MFGSLCACSIKLIHVNHLVRLLFIFNGYFLNVIDLLARCLIDLDRHLLSYFANFYCFRFCLLVFSFVCFSFNVCTGEQFFACIPRKFNNGFRINKRLEDDNLLCAEVLTPDFEQATWKWSFPQKFFHLSRIVLLFRSPFSFRFFSLDST